MHRGLYGKLAVTNIKNSKQFYWPYLLTAVLTVAMFYIMTALAKNEGLKHLPGEEIGMIMGLGTGVIAIFAVIFLFYTNSFIIKRRKKELGIYNILGMEKRHLAKVLALETLVAFLVSVMGGLAAGIVFNKLACMFLYKLMGADVGIDFYISYQGIGMSLLLFSGIFLCTLFYNMMQVKLAKPVELLRGSSAGEREPKTKIVMTIIGAAAIAGGYYIAITTINPIDALMMFFVAVILVILGTYCLFTSGSIALLKLLRKHKNYYYKTKHFNAVSGMIYRMKQNAAGLSNICILSTMVLVMVSGTISLYAGIGDELDERFPSDLSILAYYDSLETLKTADAWSEDMEQVILDSGREILNKKAYTQLSFTTVPEKGQFLMRHSEIELSAADLMMLTVINREACAELCDYNIEKLDADEVVLITMNPDMSDTFIVGGQEFDVKDVLEFKGEDDSAASTLYNYCYVVVNDDAAMDVFYRLQEQAYGEDKSSYTYNMYIDIDGNEEEKIACGAALQKQLGNSDNAAYSRAYSECKLERADDFRAMFGGFLFLGLFLGGMFLMVTVLIIFYKQISEGYEDKERFAIMEKVGMSNAEVKVSIRAQIRIVFLLPIATAAVHVFAAFPMIKRLLALFNLRNGTLFAWCMIGVVAAFFIIYLLVFWLTSKTYYKIVGEQVK